jgi:hypothetical protein
MLHRQTHLVHLTYLCPYICSLAGTSFCKRPRHEIRCGIGILTCIATLLSTRVGRVRWRYHSIAPGAEVAEAYPSLLLLIFANSSTWSFKEMARANHSSSSSGSGSSSGSRAWARAWARSSAFSEWRHQVRVPEEDLSEQRLGDTLAILRVGTRRVAYAYVRWTRRVLSRLCLVAAVRVS